MNKKVLKLFSPETTEPFDILHGPDIPCWFFFLKIRKCKVVVTAGQSFRIYPMQ